MNWFKYLVDKGYFNPSENPEPIPVEKGYQIPRWDALIYLEKIAAEFREGRSLENVPTVIEIIDNISRNPKDNHSTWYILMKILSDIPNELVPVSLFDHIPVWLQTRFGNSTQSMALLSYLLPRYLPEHPTADDAEKVQKILYHSFSLARTEHESYNSGRYSSIVYQYYLQEYLVNKNLIDKITFICDFKPLDRLLDQLNLMLRDHDILDKIPTHENCFLKLHQNDSTLEVVIERHKNTTNAEPDILANALIENYFDRPTNQVIEQFVELARQAGIENIDLSQNPWKRACFFLSHDVVSMMNHSHFEDLRNEIHNHGDTMEIFALLSLEFLNSFTRQKQNETNAYIRNILTKQRFQLPFFRRLVLYVISENYETLGDIFWEMIADNDKDRIFSEYGHFHELFLLLSRISTILKTSQISLLKQIIEQGPQGDRHYEDRPDTWRHRWLSALQSSPAFADWYNTIEIALGFKKKINYAEEGKVKMLKGNPSPYTDEELLAMSNEEIIQRIEDFRPSGEWDGDTLDGFADTLSEAAKKDPARIVQLLPELINQPKIFLYQLCYGLANAWKEKKSFDWEIVLTNILVYLERKDEEQSEPTSGQRLQVKNDSVHLAVGRLLSDGMKNDSNAFDPKLLPLAEQIILLLAADLVPEISVVKDKETDYTMRLLNTRTGTVLRALLDYCLRAARIQGESATAVKWSDKHRQLFDHSFEKKIIETWTLLGMYFPQFLYLDNNWTIARIADISNEDYEYISALMGGVAFGNPPGTKPLYNLFYPLYKTTIEVKQDFNSTYYHGIIRHLAAFYFWNLENIDSNASLLSKLILEGPVSALDNLAGFLMTQFKTYNKSSASEKTNLLEKVVAIWKHILKRLSNAESADEQQVLARLIYLIEYIPVLTPEYADLVAKSAKFAGSFHFRHHLIMELRRLANTENALFIATIINELSFEEYLYDEDQEAVTEIVRFLYENGQKETANKISNKLALTGQEFLRQLYQEFNN